LLRFLKLFCKTTGFGVISLLGFENRNISNIEYLDGEDIYFSK